jgi:hypothetical protein
VTVGRLEGETGILEDEYVATVHQRA